MKTLLESILNIDDLDDTINKTAAQLALDAIEAHIDLSANISDHKLQITCDSTSVLIYRLDTDALKKLGITQVHFKGCLVIFHCHLKNISISSDRGIHFGRCLWTEPIANVKFEAPYVHATYQLLNPDYKNIEIIAPNITILSDPTQGTKKLSKNGFGKFTKTKFTITDCDQYIMDKATKKVTLKEILPEGINVSAKFILIETGVRTGSVGGYFIADPKYRHNLESDSIISEPIGTLKDGWLITQTKKDSDYLRKVFK